MYLRAFQKGFDLLIRIALFYLAHLENAHFFIMKVLTMKNQEMTSYLPESEHFSWGFDLNQLYWSNEHLCKKSRF